MKKKTFLLLSILIFLPRSALRAADRNTENQALQDQLEKVQDVCGRAPEGTIDWTSFDSSDPGQNSIGEFCQAPAEALYAICGLWNDNPHNQMAARKIKNIICSFGGAGKRTVSLSDHGTLRFSVDWDLQDNRDFITSYLKKTLGVKDKS
jgi:hypothetical protein